MSGGAARGTWGIGRLGQFCGVSVVPNVLLEPSFAGRLGLPGARSGSRRRLEGFEALQSHRQPVWGQQGRPLAK